MSKYRALSAASTGLPWHTGIVHTAKCSVGGEINKDMFRRCVRCAHLACSKCFNRAGFKHKCTEGQALGPFPTHKQESEIMHLFDAKIPPRDTSKPEKPAHNGSWQWTPTSEALNLYPGLQMAGETHVRADGYIAPDSLPAAFSVPDTSASAPMAGSSSLPPTSPAPQAQYQVVESMDIDTDNALLSHIESPLPAASASTTIQIPKKQVARSKKRKTVVVDSEEDDKVFDIGGEDYHPNRPAPKRLAKQAESVVRTKPSRAKRGPTPQYAELDDNSDDNGDSVPERAVDMVLDPQPMPSHAHLMGPSATEVEEFKTSIKTKRTFQLDMGNSLNITMYPGFFLSDPTGEPGNILDNNSPVTLPVALGFQFRNSVADTLERNTIAVIQSPGGNVDAPAIAAVASSYDPGRQGISNELKAVFERAILGGSPYGDGSGLSKPSDDE